MEVHPDIWDGFSFCNYMTGEKDILQPRLEAKGYTNIIFSMGEYDSFGPLSRVVNARLNGERIKFIYG